MFHFGASFLMFHFDVSFLCFIFAAKKPRSCVCVYTHPSPYSASEEVVEVLEENGLRLFCSTTRGRSLGLLRVQREQIEKPAKACISASSTVVPPGS